MLYWNPAVFCLSVTSPPACTPVACPTSPSLEGDTIAISVASLAKSIKLVKISVEKFTASPSSILSMVAMMPSTQSSM